MTNKEIYKGRTQQLAILAGIIATSSTLLLPTDSHAVNVFVEGSIGYNFYADVDADLGFTTEAGNITDATLDYDDGISYGAEIGISHFDPYDVLRLSASWEYFDAEFDSGKATVSGGTVFPPGPVKITSSDDLDIEINLFMANLYYDFETKWAFKPFIGAGLGLADIKDADDKELAWKLMLGGNYEFTDHFGIGLRYQYVQISGPDQNDLKFDDIGTSTVSATARYQF
ncbi:MAG: outer membrane beta-barrel protein [gamma proteobacterium symbiont of Bathyaustriella thionipta]|nr:outer membrane beta-barrel protein [gamma proteobacterium symbiont of Bathyaustriella thionipta]